MLFLLQTAPTPASAYLLCYFPLALIVLGLITWFVITDRHASRPYLRYNPFVAASNTPEELAQREPAIGETPAGSLGPVPAGATTVFGGEHGEKVAVPEGAAPEPDAPESDMPLEGKKAPLVNPAIGALPERKRQELNTDAPGDAKPKEVSNKKPKDDSRR